MGLSLAQGRRGISATQGGLGRLMFAKAGQH